ncbi:MAG TPA: hypothetical protein VNI55_14360 [Gaiellaceae bacterium]|nr:hypothetical protein [Gaiellaceae bacterium]
MIASYDEADFDRAVALVSAEPSLQALVRRLGFDWDYLGWIALDASAAVIGEEPAPQGSSVAYGGEAFTAGFLIGVFLPLEPRPDAGLLGDSVATVQRRGRHAVIADHCDLASVARLEAVYTGALVESIDADGGSEGLAQPVTRIFEAGLAVGLLVGSGGAAPGDET